MATDPVFSHTMRAKREALFKYLRRAGGELLLDKDCYRQLADYGLSRGEVQMCLDSLAENRRVRVEADGDCWVVVRVVKEQALTAG